MPAYLTGQPFNASAAEAVIEAAAASPGPADPRETEDCLFLDVVVPEQIFNRASQSNTSTKGAPVLVWIHGGGYTSGEKTGYGLYNPAGLIKASQIDGSDGVVYVALNYRVRAALKLCNHQLTTSSLEHSVGWRGQLFNLTARRTRRSMTKGWRFNGCKATSTFLVVIPTALPCSANLQEVCTQSSPQPTMH